MLVLDIQNPPARSDQGAKREAGKQIGFPFFPPHIVLKGHQVNRYLKEKLIVAPCNDEHNILSNFRPQMASFV